MAIYHLNSSIVQRSAGRSAVAAAAYRSGMKLSDDRQDRIFDYQNKKDAANTFIITPEDAAEWMKDREQLWNGVESFEKRKDAQLAREIEVSLPEEFTLEQNTALIKEFIQQQFVDKGMIADVAIHNGKIKDKGIQPHAHILLTMRKIEERGFGKKVRAWNEKASLLTWREEWANISNKHLTLHGFDIRIDHRSYEEQGISLEAQYKIGSAEDKHINFIDHQRIAKENGEKIYANPEIALDAISKQQSTFTKKDLARFINRHTVYAEQFQRVFSKVKSSKEIISLGYDDKQEERFTTHKMLNIETEMLAKSLHLTNAKTHAVDESNFSHILDIKPLSEEQTIAFKHIIAAGDLKCLIGFAGTGKSYLLDSARQVWEEKGYRVLGATLSGIAAQSLEASSGIESRTIASRQLAWDKSTEVMSKNDILVVDEAGMIGSRQMHYLINKAELSGAKIVLIGDPEQLQAIEAGAAFRAIANKCGSISLTEIKRQKALWQQEASKELALGETSKAISRYEEKGNLHQYSSLEEAKYQMVSLWHEARITHPSKTQIMLSFTRADVKEVNLIARNLRLGLGELGKSYTFDTERGVREFAEKDRVYFLKNDRQLGVKNGSLGTIAKIKDQELLVLLDNEQKQVTVNLSTYKHIDYGYAATIHKAQGITVEKAYILASSHLDRHATYVGLTRHRENCEVFWSTDLFKNKDHLIKELGKERTKDISLDYINQYGAHRGLSLHINRKEIAKLLDDLPVLTEKEQADPTTNQNRLNYLQKFSLKYPDIAEKIQSVLYDARELLEKQALKVKAILINIEQRFKTENKEAMVAPIQKLRNIVINQDGLKSHINNNHPLASEKLQIKTIDKERELER